MDSHKPRPGWVLRLHQFIGDDIYDDPTWDNNIDTEEDDQLLDAIERAVNDLLCTHYGHVIVDDMCRIPEHRYCEWCCKAESVIKTSNEGTNNGADPKGNQQP